MKLFDEMLVKVIGYWNRYWFRPASLINLAVCRLLIVGYQLFYLMKMDYLTKMQVLSRFQESQYDPLPILHFLVMPLGWTYRPSFETLEIIFYITLLIGMVGFIGFLTNISLTLFAVGNIIMQGYIYSHNDIHHPQGIMMIALFVLAMSPAGAVLSIDRFRKEGVLNGTSSYARWPLLLVQWIFALSYFSAAKSKMVMSGFDWLNGFTLQYYLASDAMRDGIALGLWLSQHHLLSKLLSLATVIIEGTFFLVLIFPMLTLVYVPLGVALHVGMYLTMRANFFQWIVLYSVFIPWVRLPQILCSSLNLIRNFPKLALVKKANFSWEAPAQGAMPHD